MEVQIFSNSAYFLKWNLNRNQLINYNMPWSAQNLVTFSSALSLNSSADMYPEGIFPEIAGFTNCTVLG